MVRINLIKPKYLADQHLIAEYAEILILLDYIKKHPETDNIPKKFCLGKGHQKFFKNKILYLKKRHEKLKQEMKKRNFHPKKTINLKNYKKSLVKDWKPNKEDLKIIKKRITERINLKPEFYRYYGKHYSKKFLIDLIQKS